MPTADDVKRAVLGRGTNPYVAFNNNPVNNVDPDARAPVSRDVWQPGPGWRGVLSDPGNPKAPAFWIPPGGARIVGTTSGLPQPPAPAPRFNRAWHEAKGHTWIPRSRDWSSGLWDTGNNGRYRNCFALCFGQPGPRGVSPEQVQAKICGKKPVPCVARKGGKVLVAIYFNAQNKPVHAALLDTTVGEWKSLSVIEPPGERPRGRVVYHRSPADLRYPGAVKIRCYEK